MRKVIFEYEAKTISLDKLIRELYDSSDLIVYYRSRNEANGIPCFFKKARTEFNSYRFMSPIASYGSTYVSNSIRESLKEAAINRQLFVIKKHEMNKLFKEQL